MFESGSALDFRGSVKNNQVENSKNKIICTKEKKTRKLTKGHEQLYFKKTYERSQNLTKGQVQL